MKVRGYWRWVVLGVLSAAGGAAWAAGPHHGDWQEAGKPEWQVREEQRQRNQQQWERDQEWQRRQQEEQRQRAEAQRRRDEAWQRQQEAELRRRADDQRRRDEAWQRQQEREQEQERRAAWQHRGSYGTVYPPAYPPGYGHYWERGQRYDGPVYIVQDYGRYRLRRPPHGHHWVRADRGYLLITTSSGVIVEVVAR